MGNNLTASLLFVLFISVANRLSAQNDSVKHIYNIDTLKFYDVSLASEPRDGKIIYLVNNKEVNKLVYQNFYSVWHNIGLCKPCVLKVYDENEILVRISLQHTDCPVGSWTEYYPNGVIKVKGQFIENTTGNWSDLSKRGLCRQTGVWQYFDVSGNIIKTEKYLNGSISE